MNLFLIYWKMNLSLKKNSKTMFLKDSNTCIVSELKVPLKNSPIFSHGRLEHPVEVENQRMISLMKSPRIF